ncbi:MAG: TatD family hydrolase, TatD DNase family protein [Candidatus Peregrinibacteria bacterium GW2011_GWC2_39_14]|nr:MAG: TatD family hydrolase, TatD DNase family protein [Candidatus Peregrinibacteria bacterium GW2011_GWC2_39_14]
MFIDTHAHLTFPEFEPDLEQVIDRAKKAGVEKIINIGCDLKSCSGVLELSAKYGFMYSALGMHPYETKLVDETLMSKFFEQAQADKKQGKKIVAIGEIGLDYFKAQTSHEEQVRAFKLQLELAKNLDLPVIIHARDSEIDVLQILQDFKGLRFVFHCYTGNVDFAKQIWERGGMTSFTGISTYPKAQNVRDTIFAAPIDRIMIETDCPFLAPQAFRGQRNEPAFVVEVAKEIQKIKGLDMSTLEVQLQKNSEEFFGI